MYDLLNYQINFYKIQEKKANLSASKDFAPKRNLNKSSSSCCFREMRV